MIIQLAAQPYTSENFTVATGSTVTLTTGLYFPSSGVCRSMANRAFISMEKGSIRYKMNGDAPATGCGHLFVAGDYLVLDDVAQMQGLKMKNEGQTAASTARIYVTYFGG